MQQRAKFIRYARQAALNDGVDTPGGDVLRQRILVNLGKLPGFFCQRAHHLYHKKGVAFGFALQELHQLFAGMLLPQNGRTQRYQICFGESTELDGLHIGQL